MVAMRPRRHWSGVMATESPDAVIQIYGNPSRKNIISFSLTIMDGVPTIATETAMAWKTENKGSNFALNGLTGTLLS